MQTFKHRNEKESIFPLPAQSNDPRVLNGKKKTCKMERHRRNLSCTQNGVTLSSLQRQARVAIIVFYASVEVESRNSTLPSCPLIEICRSVIILMKVEAHLTLSSH